ncbi:Zn-dependent oxidoreductase [Modestobacter caceresii]|uniref:Zn-dependent oxidoreductase n=1 Tax=Modestobacter caceresii TaxID=1522368 RepID=UPI0009DD692C|nr:Zn-dependent oxidoreductase [Modestobacter caceresii]
MRAVQTTHSGGREIFHVADLPDPVPGEGQATYDISSCGVDFADTHHRVSGN